MEILLVPFIVPQNFFLINSAYIDLAEDTGVPLSFKNWHYYLLV